MGAPRLALGALVLALGLAGCGASDSTFTAVEQAPATATTTTSASSGAEPPANPLAVLPAHQQKALAALVQAQSALMQRGDAVANAGTQTDKVLGRISAGYTAPSGPSTPQVRRLADALEEFGSTLATMATQENLLPQLSLQLRRAYARLAKARPRAAARILTAKQQVDQVVAALPQLQQTLGSAAAKARAQASATTLDAQTLNDAVEGGSESATSALNGVNQAIEAGVQALAAA